MNFQKAASTSSATTATTTNSTFPAATNKPKQCECGEVSHSDRTSLFCRLNSTYIEQNSQKTTVKNVYKI